MKRIFLILALFCLVLTANAQVIHWITFIDTTDGNVGEFDVKGREVLYDRFINVINAALRQKGYESHVLDFYGYRTTPENCKRAVERLTCRPEDIIVFYYIGHGAHAEKEKKDPYPQMALANFDEGKNIPLSWVHRVLKSKGARFTATIGMCCNSLSDRLTAKNAPTFSVNYGNAKLNSKQLSAIQNMFLDYKGDFILSSASLGQSSWDGETPLKEHMDLFTAVTVTLFEEYSKTGSLDWKSFFNNVSNTVNQVSGGRQTPFFEANLTSASAPSPAPTPKTQPSTSSTNLDDPIVVGNMLTRYFDFLIDANQDWKKRKSVSETAMKMFSTDAIVKIMSQDGDRVVDSEEIDVFLSRLATNEILLKVVPIEYKSNESSNKITKLIVKEYYKE